MIRKLIKRLLGIDVLEFRARKDYDTIRELENRIKVLEGQGTYVAADVGYNDATCVVVMRKRPNAVHDLVDIYNFPPQLSFKEVNDAICSIARRYGVDKSRLYVDQPMQSQVARKRLFE